MNTDNINLDCFPVNEVAQRLLTYVTRGWYDKSYVAKWIFEIIGEELDTAIKSTAEIQNQVFPQTATWGLYLHEIMYGIPINQKEPIEDRRRQITKYRDSTIKSPLNPYRIENIISSVYGLRSLVVEYCDKYIIVINLLIDLSYLMNIEYIYQVIGYVKKIKPSHLSLSIRAAIEQIVCYNIEDFISKVLLLRTHFSLCKKEKINIRMQMPLPHMLFSENIDVALIRRKAMWRLDGSELLDGKKQLNALEEKEKL